MILLVLTYTSFKDIQKSGWNSFMSLTSMKLVDRVSKEALAGTPVIV